MLQAIGMKMPTVDELMDSPLSKFIHFASNDCGYSGSVREPVCKWVHPLFLKAKAAAGQEDNPNWFQAMNDPFVQDYWKAAKVEIATLKGMDAWEVVKQTADMCQNTSNLSM